MNTGRQIQYSREALKALAKMDSKAAKQIVAKVEQLANDPASLANNVKKLTGRPEYRLRVGDYRVIYSETLVVLNVIKVGHRREIYG